MDSDLPPVLGNPCLMQPVIDLPCPWLSFKTMRLLPRAYVPLIVQRTTLTTWPVACCQSSSFVTEKQFRVIAGLHESAAGSLVGENARDPSLMLPSRPSEVAVIVVKNAPVPHEQATGRAGFELTKRGHA